MRFDDVLLREGNFKCGVDGTEMLKDERVSFKLWTDMC